MHYVLLWTTSSTYLAFNNTALWKVFYFFPSLGWLAAFLLVTKLNLLKRSYFLKTSYWSVQPCFSRRSEGAGFQALFKGRGSMQTNSYYTSFHFKCLFELLPWPLCSFRFASLMYVGLHGSGFCPIIFFCSFFSLTDQLKRKKKRTLLISRY